MKVRALFIGLSFILLFLAWEGFSFFAEALAFVLPSPSQILIRLFESPDRFLFHTGMTASEMLAGFLLAFLVAFPLAWLMDLFQSARDFFQPLFILIQCIPMFTLAPLMVMWFGWSYAAIIIPTALMIFFPLTMNIYQGLRSTPQELLDYFKVNQATAWQTFIKLKLPWALPHIFAGFRISAAIAGIAAVAGEWAGAQTGLGVLMMESRRDADLETNFAALFCLMFVSYGLYLFIVGCEILATSRTFWHQRFKALYQKQSVQLAIGLILMSGLIFESCQRKPVSQAIRLTLDWLPNPNHIPLYVGLNKGFFKKQGIDLTIQKLPDSGHAIPYLTSQQCDLCLSYMPRVIRMQHQGASIEPIAILIKEPLNAFIYRDEGMANSDQLNHCRLGFCNGAKDTAFLDALLANGRIKPSFKQFIGFDLVTWFAAGKVDVIYGAYWNIEAEHLRQLGIPVKFIKLSEFGVPNYYELIVLAKTGSDQVKSSFINAFQSALQQSIDYAKEHPEEAFAIYAHDQKDKSPKTLQWEKAAWKATLSALADQQSISAEEWKAFEDWLASHHLL